LPSRSAASISIAAAVPCLRAVDWQIRPGQRWLLIGGNGAGKTQLSS
jgi:ABC-type molybdenum transport system ATPase subunit/photorepair protein PhrA